jgi:hypothetical protein
MQSKLTLRGIVICCHVMLIFESELENKAKQACSWWWYTNQQPQQQYCWRWVSGVINPLMIDWMTIKFLTLYHKMLMLLIAGNLVDVYGHQQWWPHHSGCDVQQIILPPVRRFEPSPTLTSKRQQVSPHHYSRNIRVKRATKWATKCLWVSIFKIKQSIRNLMWPR